MEKQMVILGKKSQSIALLITLLLFSNAQPHTHKSTVPEAITKSPALDITPYTLTKKQMVAAAIIAAALTHSTYTHLMTLPHTNPSRYSTENLKTKGYQLIVALKAKDAAAIKKALDEVRTELNYFYEDGLCGHPSAVEGPHHHGHSHKAEMIVIPSRGVYGWVNSRFMPLIKAISCAGFLVKTVHQKGANIPKALNLDQFIPSLAS